ncbi:SLC13 family permease [Roseibium salinum]|nr:SLC13 family permease [Roseibium salinum]
MFLPILTAVAATTGQSPARVLMPLSFIAILGGMTTLIGSSTNLLVANYAAQSSDLRLTFFSFTPIGLIVAGAGSIYVLYVMPRFVKNPQNHGGRVPGDVRQTIHRPDRDHLRPSACGG